MKLTSCLLVFVGTLCSILLLTSSSAGAQSSRYVWFGNVTPNSFTIVLDVQSSSSEKLLIATDSKFKKVVKTAKLNSAEGKVKVKKYQTNVYDKYRKFTVTGLKTSTKYYVGVGKNKIGEIRTFPKKGVKQTVVFGLGSCQYRAESSQSLGELAMWNQHYEKVHPFIMLHMGDLHYANIDNNDVEAFESETRDVVTDTNGATKLFSTTPVTYMYDDHDFGDNNSDGTSDSEPAVLANYKGIVPHYPMVDKKALYHAFTVADVRVIVTDLRSESLEGGQMFAKGQRKWLFREFDKAKDYSVVVWLSSRPWIKQGASSGDSWGGFTEDRRLVANYIAQKKITNLVIVSGDMHALAVDDGTNSDYSDQGGAGFPVFHAAPLANTGSGKGGPYSEGCVGRYSYNSQYAILKVSYDKGKPCVHYRGYTTTGATTVKEVTSKRPVLKFSKCGKLGGVRGVKGGGQDYSCSLRSPSEL